MNVVENEIMKELTIRERILFILFRKDFIKIYKLGITFGFNNK